jgi:hypothetical protein
MFSWLCFQMDMSDYPHISIAEDGRLCSMGQHRPGFPRVLYDALLHLGYNRDIPVYRACMSVAHSMEQCEVSVTIPLSPEEPWMATVINVELDDTVDQTRQHRSPLLHCVGAALLTPPRCRSHSFRFAIRETACGSSTLRPYPTLRAHTSMLAWLLWPSMRNTHSTYSTTPPRLLSSSVCVWPLMMSATSLPHMSSHS